jgi:hypothetical protein
LTLGAREGSFLGMLTGHTFHVVLVEKNHGVGIGDGKPAGKTVAYKGAKLSVQP